MPWNSPRNPLGIVPLWAWLIAIALVAVGVAALGLVSPDVSSLDPLTSLTECG